MDDFSYKPSMEVVRGARYFIRALCETYGNERGMEVWDHIRTGLGDNIAGDIFLGMLMGTDSITVLKIPDNRPIECIKWVRHLTGWGLRESKDFVDHVRTSGPKRIDTAGVSEEKIEAFAREMRAIGAVVE